MLQVLLKSR